MPSLEELIKQFAERARRQLMEEAEQLKNKDTSTAKWQGYDADGNPIVKDGDQTKTVKGLGNTGMVKGTKLIIDDVGSVEYKRRTKQEKDKKISPKQRRVAEPTRLVVRDNLISVAAAFEEEINYLTEEELPEFEIIDDGFYICTYTTMHYTYEIDGEAVHADDDNLYETANMLVPDFDNTATGGQCYRIIAASVLAQSWSFSPYVGTASASISGPGINLSVQTSGAQQKVDVAIDVQETTAGGDFELTVEGDVAPVTVSGLLSGEARAAVVCVQISLPRAIYYYQISNDPNDGTKRIREIDLNDIVPGKVVKKNLIHNFANREGDTVFVYSIFYVIDVDMDQTEIQSGTTVIDDEDEKAQTLMIGKKGHHIVHTRLNMKTGEVETKINESPNTGDFSLGNPVEYGNTCIGDSCNWFLRGRVAAGNIGNFVFADIDAHFGFTNNQANELDNFNPEGVWKNSFPGDWLYVYRDVPWDSSAEANISNAELFDFLQSSYKQNIFYRGWDSTMPYTGFYGTDSPEFIEWDPTGDGFEGNARPDGDFHDIENLQARIELSGTNIEYANYFDGSQANAPDDFDDWKDWFDNNIGPDFNFAENVYLPGTPNVPFGDLIVGRFRKYLNYVPPST